MDTFFLEMAYISAQELGLACSLKRQPDEILAKLGMERDKIIENSSEPSKESSGERNRGHRNEHERGGWRKYMHHRKRNEYDGTRQRNNNGNNGGNNCGNNKDNHGTGNGGNKSNYNDNGGNNENNNKNGDNNGNNGNNGGNNNHGGNGNNINNNVGNINS
ncbi:uncharacterized protein LOC131069054 [Cryptomeria japonica]|uniref:uncharacterized protein LOC131069054 n=1 Tax=Cryptomeria japonica TaxID=3369 RepID=UPI0027DA3CAC|nr:uncharacterized protein LOC131069054 [Cryptomeria japonica]